MIESLPTPVVISGATAVSNTDPTIIPPSKTPELTPTRPDVSPTPDPTRISQPESKVITHQVSYGESLGYIATLYSTTIDEILAANNVTDINTIQVGTNLTIPVNQLPTGPADKLIPDSELVYGPGFSHFDVATFAGRYGGYLVNFTEEVNGEIRYGPDIVQLVAQQYSVGPRLLLTLLEFESGWVTTPNPYEDTLYYPMGKVELGWDGLYTQLSWAADQLNRGYYGWQAGWLLNVDFSDGTLVQLNPGLNGGTAAVQYFLSLYNTNPTWQSQVTWDGSFIKIFHSFFGNPFQYAIEPLIPSDLTQPEMVLPWDEGEIWYITGGPHGGWDSNSGWAALDFVPGGDDLGCYPSDDWVRSVSRGRVLRSENGEVIVDLDDDGFEGTGWVVFYMHVGQNDRAPVGTWLEPGDKIGHPSCEGGVSYGTHVHVARRYNGRWIEAEGSIPFVMDGWTPVSYEIEYDGALVKGDQVREACECREPDFNGLLR
ncbi:MAG: LysM peptidoglycan-binding domain-containing protein [Anaerolineales bacterium]|nr:LysM peptidoglycan-binding domain-containing protein [Anaerolineales bacterium]